MNERDEIAARIAETTRLLHAAAREAGAFISGDLRVGEETAARLLGLAQGSLANRRGERTGPPFYRLGGGGHRVTYALRDLAEWIVATRCE